MKVYDSQGRLKVVGFTGPTGPPGTQSVTCAELSATASLLSAAIDVVSDGLSDLRSAHEVLSNRVSANSTVATPSVTSAEVQVVSAQAASAIASEVSNRMSADAVLSAAITIVSNAASVADVHASTASAAATSADGHANTVSARVVSVSAELASLVQIASAAATSADAHANTASAAATSADNHANTVSARVVSVSAELASLVQIASAAATSADAHANTASAAATSADAHANTASAAATSVDARIASLSAGFASLSARSVGDVSTHGFQSIFNALSNRISANTGGAGSVTSTELSVGLLGILQLRNDDGLDASAGNPVFVGASAASTFRVAAGLDNDTKEAIGMVTSTITVGATGSIQTRGILSLTSAQWDERTGQTGGLTIGSKYYLASTAGNLTLTPPFDAARAVGVAIDGNKMLLGFNLVDDARPYISAISARDFVGGSVHGFQSVVNALSNRISAVSVTSQELSVRVQVASAAATSADNHANTVSGAANVISARVVSVSAELASLVQIASAAATSADNHANTASAAATSVDARVTSASAVVQAVSAQALSTHRNLLRVEDITSLSNAGSVPDGIYYVRTGQSAGNSEVSIPPSAGLLGRRILVVSKATPAKVLATPPDIFNGGTSAASITLTNPWDNVLLIANTVDGWDVVFERAALGGGTGSVTSAEVSVLVQVASAAATSADGHANTVSSRLVSVSAELASLLASTSAALRADITSTSAVIKADINSVSAAIMADAASHLASTSAAIKADINSVSAAIMADAASHLASTSAAIKADINSVSAAIINEVSVQYGRGQFRRVTGAQAIATATFTKVSGLSLSIEGSGFYEIHGQLVWSQSGAGSASAIFNFGMSMTAQPTMAAFRMMGNAGNFAASASIVASVLPFQIQFGGASAICATPSIMYSAKPNPGASGSVAVTMFFDGVLAGSTVQSQLKVVAACSTGAFGINIQPGSYIRAFRIG